MAGNYYWGSSPYLTMTVNSTDEDLVNMSASLWSVNAYCNTQIKNIDEKSGPACTEKAKLASVGEKCYNALALVFRTFCYLGSGKCSGTRRDAYEKTLLACEFTTSADSVVVINVEHFVNNI